VVNALYTKMLIDIFKTPVYSVTLDCDNDILTQYCIEKEKSDTGRTVSNRGGYQSNNLIGLNTTCQPLFSGITKHACIFAKHMDFKNEDLKLSEVWININGYKDYNIPHIHPHTKISGVYYVQSGEGSGLIEFSREVNNLEYDWHSSTMNKLTPYNSTSWRLPTSAGTLYLFPSWLKHSVLPNTVQNLKRISFAFNLS